METKQTEARPKKVSMGKKYTSNGKPVRLLCTDAVGNKTHPVIALDEFGCAMTFTAEGKYFEGGHESDLDLVEVREARKVRVWMNVYPNGVGSWYDSRERANAYALASRIACIERELEYYVGEGLEDK